jgi:hypothetical protein
MVYFDTNVLIYAFSKNTDDERQKDISVKLVGDAIEDESLIVSELILCEFAFISHKLKENVTTHLPRIPIFRGSLKRKNDVFGQNSYFLLKNTNFQFFKARYLGLLVPEWLQENKDEIDDNLAFLSEYLKPTDITVHQRILEILKETSLYVSSFDVYHLAFSEYYHRYILLF